MTSRPSAPRGGAAPARPRPGVGLTIAPAEATAPRGALARNALFLMIAQLVSTALAVVLHAALGRALGPAAFGLLFVANSMAGFAFVIVEWGQTQYVVREIAQAPHREASLLGATLAARTLGGAIAAGFTALTAWLLGYDATTTTLAVLFVGAMLPFFLAQGISLAFRAREWMEYDAATMVVDKLTTLAGTLLALALGAGVLAWGAGLGLGGLAALGAAAWFMRRLGVARPTVRDEDLRAMLWGGAAILLTNVEGSVQPYIDAIVLSKLAPAEAVGLYGAAKSFVGTLVAPAIIVSVAAYPRLARAALGGDQLSGELRAAMRPVLGLAVLACVGTWVLAPAAVDLVYGRRGFGPAASILRLFAPGFLLLYVDNVLAVAVVAVGRTRALAAWMLVKIAAGAGLSLILVPRFQASHQSGGMGLALASAVSEVVIFAAAIGILPRSSLPRVLWLDLTRALAAGAATLALLALLPPLPLLVGMPLCILAFGSLAVAFGLVRRGELAALPGQLRRPAGGEGPPPPQSGPAR